MTLYEFASLGIDNKATTLWESGKIIVSYKDKTQRCNLYLMFGFYVEVTLDKTGVKILNITPFKRGHLLDKYLDSINLKI